MKEILEDKIIMLQQKNDILVSALEEILDIPEDDTVSLGDLKEFVELTLYRIEKG